MSDYDKMRSSDYVKSQYKTDEKLHQRIEFHNKYSTNKQGYFPWLFSQYKFSKGMKVLELGSGKGNIWQGQMDKLIQVIALTLSDYSEGMVDLLKETFQQESLTVRQMDIQEIPFEEDSFDMVIANAMLYHVPNMEKGISEVYRVLKPGGQFYASTYGTGGFMSFIGESLKSVGISQSTDINDSFTLQNGQARLKKSFDQVEVKYYEDKLEIDDVNDLVDYIYSMTVFEKEKEDMKEALKSYLEEKKNKEGILSIPKEYGTFVAYK